MSEYLTDEARDTHFRKLADRFIDTANRQTEDTDLTVINSAMMYARLNTTEMNLTRC